MNNRLQLRRQYYQKHKKAILASNKRWAKRNPEKVKRFVKAYAKKNKARICEWSRQYRLRHPIRFKRSYLKARLRGFGLTLQYYQDLKKKQENRCAICCRPMKPPQLDHDHETNTARGLLCMNCNSMLGMARDKTDILQSAINYLQFYKEKSIMELQQKEKAQ